ncbi:MAG: hypothetical protein A2161_21700 [Candidatus Schekmanbacteria bacterium RBG_13_48_7]|uniref:Type II methyltransferase M.Eco57I C-terminal domain-containing protein n=1 Tax=Candidatus Schekmanbacteria bacterium RBG_13_48_7 TaxID=1817878 RepID=A0A1F7RRL7_9BACT|nr:MAG: hypothetical protein A2161_21700 [Candidatus Schekmanbacteria bacterium RBG_13_48_7]
MIIDNQGKRSFASADVNTIIALFGAPSAKLAKNMDTVNPQSVARFVMFRVPFDEILSPVIFEEIEAAKDRKTTQEYRLFPIDQHKLFEDGCEIPEDEEPEEITQKQKTKKSKASGPTIKIARYIGNKWGGKYLRAPDIYWTILEKGKGKLVKLGDIAEVRRGFTTGANEFFYLDAEKIEEWSIEKEFLKSVIISPRECDSIEVIPKLLKFRVFVCNKTKKELKFTKALEYIKWGEEQQFSQRPSCRNRLLWYSFPVKQWAKVLWPMIHNERHCVFWNANNIAVDHNLFEIYGYNDDLLWGSLACAGQIIFRELHGRANLGQGALKTEGIDIRTFVILKIESKTIIKNIKLSRNKLSQRIIEPIHEECKKADHRELDSIIFDELSLTQGERDAVYEAVINLVEARLKKADSYKKK